MASGGWPKSDIQGCEFNDAKLPFTKYTIIISGSNTATFSACRQYIAENGG